MVDTSPDAAKKRGERESKAAAAKTVAARTLVADQLKALQRVLGTDGLDNGELIVGTDQYNQLILFKPLLDDEGNQIRRDEIFFWVDPNGIDFTQKTGTNEIKIIKSDYKSNLEVLRKKLYDKNFLNETDYETKDETAFNQAILLAGRNHSLTQVQSYTIQGKTKFIPFSKWLDTLGTTDKSKAGSGYPRRDIDLQDRDIIEAIVKNVYQRTTDNAIDDEFLKQETDRYMKQIQEGTLTTQQEIGGINTLKTTKRFSADQVAAELPERIEKEKPGATNPKKSLDFLAFLDGLGVQI